MSYAPGSSTGIIMVLNSLLLTAAGFVAVYWQSWVPLVPGVAAAFALWLFRLHIQALFSLSPQQVARARKAEGFNLLLLVIFSAMQ
jgi:hypothetical protein